MIEFTSPDDRPRQELDVLATRSYGHRVEDIIALREYAVTRVALRDGAVVAGGLGILVPQYFGGRPVPSACLAVGPVAPEDRGTRPAELLVADRIRILQDQGAVITSPVRTAIVGCRMTAGLDEPPMPRERWSTRKSLRATYRQYVAIRPFWHYSTRQGVYSSSPLESIYHILMALSRGA